MDLKHIKIIRVNGERASNIWYNPIDMKYGYYETINEIPHTATPVHLYCYIINNDMSRGLIASTDLTCNTNGISKSFMNLFCELNGILDGYVKFITGTTTPIVDSNGCIDIKIIQNLDSILDSVLDLDEYKGDVTAFDISINRIFKLKDKLYIIKESDKAHRCYKCVFYKTRICLFIACHGNSRFDNKSIYVESYNII